MLKIDLSELKDVGHTIHQHRYVATSSVIAGLLVGFFSYQLSQSTLWAIASFVLASLLMWTCLLFFKNLLAKLNTEKSQKFSLLLLSHDDEIAGQLRYLLPHDSIGIEWVRTYDNATKILKQQTPHAFIIDTENKPKNTATLVELCRSHEQTQHRLPVIAIQKDTALEKKRQLLLEGFDDCMPKPVKQQDIDTFYARWLQEEPNAFNTPPTEDNTPPKQKQPTKETTEDSGNKPGVFDRQHALIQSHKSPALAKDMLDMLVKMIKDNKAAMQQLYQQNNWAELAEMTHKIKGGCYCTGVPKLEEAMEAIDKSLEKKQLDQLPEQFDTMMAALEELLRWHEEHDLDLIFSH